MACWLLVWDQAMGKSKRGYNWEQRQTVSGQLVDSKQVENFRQNILEKSKAGNTSITRTRSLNWVFDLLPGYPSFPCCQIKDGNDASFNDDANAEVLPTKRRKFQKDKKAGKTSLYGRDTWNIELHDEKFDENIMGPLSEVLPDLVEAWPFRIISIG